MWRGKYEELKQQALQAAQHGAALGREKEGMLAQFEEMSLEQQQVSFEMTDLQNCRSAFSHLPGLIVCLVSNSSASAPSRASSGLVSGSLAAALCFFPFSLSSHLSLSLYLLLPLFPLATPFISLPAHTVAS